MISDQSSGGDTTILTDRVLKSIVTVYVNADIYSAFQ
jgi:hypothetical protein